MSHRITLPLLVALALAATVWFAARNPSGPSHTPLAPVEHSLGIDAEGDGAIPKQTRLEASRDSTSPAIEEEPVPQPVAEHDGLPNPPSDPNDWNEQQWRRFYMMKYYADVNWEEEPSPNGDLALLYSRALATLEDARGNGPLPPWDPDYERLIPLGFDASNDRLVMVINNDKYRFYPEYYPELRNWFDASQAGFDPSYEPPPGGHRRMTRETVATIKARAEEALLILSSVKFD